MPETTYTLLVWEEVPEKTTMVLIDNATLTDEDHAVLTKAHNCYINGDLTEEEEAAACCVGAALCTDPEYLDEDHPVGSRWAMRFKDCERDGDGDDDGERGKPRFIGKTITHVYRSGFLM